MQIEHHDLHREFPEHSAKITQLKVNDAHFAKLFSEYDLADHSIRRLEIEGLKISDSEMEGMKLNRVHLKDKLYAYLTKPD